MSEMKSLTLNGKKYDSFVDLDARNSIEEIAQNGVTDYNELDNKPIVRVESLDTTSLVNLRDLDSGQYILYGYFSPYANSDISISADNSMVSVIRKDAGSHIICLDPLNAKIVFFEILVDETVEKGFQYTRTVIPMLDVNALIAKVGELSELTTDEKNSLVGAINEVANKSGASDEQIASAVEDYMAEHPVLGGGLTTAQITALDNMFKVCAFTKADVSAEYNAFCAAFGIVPDEPDIPDEPTVTLTSISATYSGGDVAVGTAVTDLTGVAVTAHYSDGTSETVTGYTLSGTIAEGSNTVTATYQGKTATFTVTGVAESGGGDGTAVNLYERDGEYLIGNPTNVVWGENSLMFTSGTNEIGVYTHVKLDKLEVGKTYTLFWDAPSATDNASFIRQLHRTTASPGNAATTSFMGTTGVQATNLLAGGAVNANADYRNIHCTFTIPEDIAYLNLSFATKGTGVTGTFQNIAIYEGELTERP